MLPKNHRFGVYNDCGVALPADAVHIYAVRFQGSPDGTVVYEDSSGTVYANVSPIENEGYVTGDNVDNSTTEWEGGDFQLEINAPVAAQGDVVVCLEPRVNGNYPSSRYNGYPVVSCYVEGPGACRKAFIL